MVRGNEMRRNIPWLAFLLLAGACDKETKPLTPRERNFAPEIRSVTVRPERVLAWQEVQVMCGARDRDNDPLAYWWYATDGTFPIGSRRPIVKWRSPAVLLPQTLTVFVSDAIDTVSGELEIALAQVAPPGTLKFTNGSNLIDLTWLPSPDEGIDAWTGYEVYGARHSLFGLPIDSLGAYLRTTTPVDRLQYRVLGVTPGERTYFHIRSRREYEGLVERSAAGPEIDTAGRIWGFGRSSLFEIGARPGRGEKGVHLPGGSVETLDPSRVDRIDFYFGTESPTDEGGAPRLKSPSLLAYRDPAWASRVTGIRTIEGEWDESVAPEDGYVLELLLTVGAVYAIRTADNHYAKIEISEMRGSPPERRVEFVWAWQPLAGYPRY